MCGIGNYKIIENLINALKAKNMINFMIQQFRQHCNRDLYKFGQKAHRTTKFVVKRYH